MLDALIVGAGPTGLTLAAELLRRGLSVRIVDRLLQPMAHSRALALQSRTLEIFEKMGVLEALLREGKVVQEAQLYLNQRPLAHLDLRALKAPFPFILSLSQADTERILTAHVQQLGGSIERGTTLTDVTQEAATLQRADGTEETVTARWVFGCDGAHSAVRHALHLPFRGAPFPEVFALADVAIDGPLPHNALSAFLTSQGLCALVPLSQPRFFRIIAQCGRESKPPETLEEFQEIVSQFSGLPLTLTDSIWIASFTLHRRITPQFRQGNIFLLGDAAHIHSPVGGQGLNNAVQDAFNLAWKIGLVHQGVGKEVLLKSFHEERYPIAQAILKYTTFATRMITSPVVRKYVLPLLRPVFRSRHWNETVAAGVSELEIAYKKSSIVDYKTERSWKGPKPGTRAPDAVLFDGSRLFAHLTHTKHTLLSFGSVAAERVVKERYGQVCEVVSVRVAEGAPVCEVYGVKGPCFYLIRPDGYVAFRFRGEGMGAFLAYLQRIFNASESR